MALAPIAKPFADNCTAGASDTRTQRLVEDFNFNVLFQLPPNRAENRANSFGYASILANYVTDVLWMDSQF